MKQTLLIGFGLGCLLLISKLSAQNLLCEVESISPEEVKVEGFRLKSPQEVKIKAVGFRGGKKGFVFTRCWMLNARTRALVWDQEDADSQKRGSRLLEYEDAIKLQPGDYEVYYSSYPYHYDDDGFGHFFSGWFRDFWDSDNDDETYRHHKKDWDQFRIAVWGKGERFRGHEVEELRKEFLKNTFLSETSIRDEENQQIAFKVERPIKIQIYALGEARRDGTFDYGWILNADTREKVWKFDYRSSKYAGGARKNRLINETLDLPAGEYVAIYVSDDSHSTGRWNAAPPNDPDFWGITLKTENSSDLRYVHKLDDPNPLENEDRVICKLTRVRSNEFRSQAFKCKKDTKIRIYALGEGNRGQMFDYGWIVNATTNQKTWEMNYRSTEHAGGGEKNRLFDKVMPLQKGTYIVYYVTDDSHSYWDWNTAPPYDQEHWGITIYAADPHFKPGDIIKVDEKDDETFIAKLAPMRNYERERKRFTLDQNTEVRIYALGEGSGGDMYDYGWIENADTRQIIWEMTYNKTSHAGGASKNRVFDGTLILKRGDYMLHYETDGSHSFGDWNAAPPYDPVNWGISIRKAEE